MGEVGRRLFAVTVQTRLPLATIGSLLFFNVFIYFERERAGEEQREGERERERERENPKQAPSCQRRAPCRPGTHELGDRDLSQNQELDASPTESPRRPLAPFP